MLEERPPGKSPSPDQVGQEWQALWAAPSGWQLRVTGGPVSRALSPRHSGRRPVPCSAPSVPSSHAVSLGAPGRPPTKEPGHLTSKGQHYRTWEGATSKIFMVRSGPNRAVCKQPLTLAWAAGEVLLAAPEGQGSWPEVLSLAPGQGPRLLPFRTLGIRAQMGCLSLLTRLGGAVF